MILLGILLLQVLCIPLQLYAAASPNASASTSPTPALSNNTVTIEVAASMFSSKGVEPTTSKQPVATSALVQSLHNEANKLLNNIGSGSNGATTDSNAAKGECGGLDWTPMQHSTTECSLSDAEKVSNLIKCIGSKPENVSSMDLAAMVESVGKCTTNDLMAQVNQGKVHLVNASSLLIRDTFALGSGVLDGVFINTTKDEYLTFPNYSEAEKFTGQWETVRDQISVPVEVLQQAASGNIPYTWSLYPNIIEDRPLKMTEIETDYNQIIKDSDVSDLYLDEDGVLKTRKKVQDVYINSYVFSLDIIKSSFHGLKNPVLITFRHKKSSFEEPSCVFWDNSNSIWSRKGCQIRETNSTHTICACNHLTTFAVAMKEKIIEDLSNREAVVTTATVFGVISTLLLVGSFICILVVGYHFVDNMRIALNIDVALLLGQLFFFVGLSNSSSKYISTPATCDVISPFVHMFELAALTFLLMEGIFYVERFTTIFNKNNTNTFYIYMSLGWGLPVAFGAACAGYSYRHYGSPSGNEFCWMSVYGVDAWYFGTPVLILVLLNLTVRGVVLHKVLGWKGNPDDINIERTKFRLISFIVLLPVIILTWLFGILATNHSDKKVYHYLFIIFYFLQGLLVFIFYCAKNTERLRRYINMDDPQTKNLILKGMTRSLKWDNITAKMWDYYKDKKEKEYAEKTAVYRFQYVP